MVIVFFQALMPLPLNRGIWGGGGFMAFVPKSKPQINVCFFKRGPSPSARDTSIFETLDQAKQLRSILPFNSVRLLALCRLTHSSSRLKFIKPINLNHDDKGQMFHFGTRKAKAGYRRRLKDECIYLKYGCKNDPI